MGFLFLIVMGIFGIILIARVASKSRRGEEAPAEHSGIDPNGREGGRIIRPEEKKDLEEGLVALLIKKKIITEEELLSEIELLRKIKE